MEQSDLDALTSSPTQENTDMSDPRQRFAWALLSFPAPNKDMGDVPIHPMVRPEMSQRLSDFGFEYNPAKQTKWLLPGDHPEAGYLNIPRIVDRKEYDEYLAAHTNPQAEADSWRAMAEAALEKLDPKLLSRINNMTDEQRAAAAAVQRDQLPAAFERLAQLQAETEQ